MKAILKISQLPYKGRNAEGMSADHWLMTLHMRMGIFSIALTLTWVENTYHFWMQTLHRIQAPDPGQRASGCQTCPRDIPFPCTLPFKKISGIFVSSTANRQTQNITELSASCSICLLVDWPLMMERNTFHIASAGKLHFHLCHTLFFIGQGDNVRIVPHPLTYFV